MKQLPVYNLWIFFIVILAGNACVDSSSNKIIHLNFLDNIGNVYMGMDTSRTTPFKSVTRYFLIDRSSNIDYKHIQEYMDTSILVKHDVEKKYSRLTLMFYKKSDCTSALMEIKSRKYLADCNDDILIEYVWDDGELTDTFYYKDGLMEGAENIKLR